MKRKALEVTGCFMNVLQQHISCQYLNATQLSVEELNTFSVISTSELACISQLLEFLIGRELYATEKMCAYINCFGSNITLE